MAFTVTGAAAFCQAAAETFFTLLCSRTDRGAVTGKGKMQGIKEPAFNGLVQELLPVQPENQPERVLCFEFPAFQQGNTLSITSSISAS